MRRRQLIVQMRKMNTPEDETATPSEDQIEKFIELLPKILLGGVIAVYGYVLLDTARQIAVAQYSQ